MDIEIKAIINMTKMLEIFIITKFLNTPPHKKESILLLTLGSEEGDLGELNIILDSGQENMNKNNQNFGYMADKEDGDQKKKPMIFCEIFYYLMFDYLNNNFFVTNNSFLEIMLQIQKNG